MADAVQIQEQQPQDVIQAPLELDRKAYKTAVESARKEAYWNCIRVKLTSLIAVCNLTWTTAVILGGHGSSLTLKQVMWIEFLLITQALIQFGILAFWYSFLPHISLISHVCSARPSFHFLYIKKARILGSIEVLFYFLPAVFVLLKYENLILLLDTQHKKLTNVAFLVFFILTATNAGINLVGQANAWENAAPRLFGAHSFRVLPPLLNYFESLVRTGLTQGLQGLNQLQVEDAVFEMMSQELKSDAKCEPNEILVAYESMIYYVYGHDEGFEAALAAMESSDRYLQEAAIHTVGFWAFYHEQRALQKRLRFEKALLRKLVHLCTSSAGRLSSKAAKNIEMFLKMDPKGFMKGGEESRDLVRMLVRHVIELMDLLGLDPLLINELTHDNTLHLYESLLHILKALIWLLTCDKDCFCECLTSEQQTSLKESLLSMFKSCNMSWKRMQVIVGHALHLLGSTRLTEALVYQHLKAVTLTRQFDLFDEEHAWLIDLLGRDAPLNDWQIKQHFTDDIYAHTRTEVLSMYQKYARVSLLYLVQCCV